MWIMGLKIGGKPSEIFFLEIESKVEGWTSNMAGRLSMVEDGRPRIEGRGPRVEGRGSRVEDVNLPSIHNPAPSSKVNSQ